MIKIYDVIFSQIANKQKNWILLPIFDHFHIIGNESTKNRLISK